MYLVEGVLHLVKVRPFVEVAGQQLGQQGLGNVSHAAQDEADEDLHDGGPGKLHILLALLAVGKGHQEQQQRQAGSQEAGHRFLQDTTVQSSGCSSCRSRTTEGCSWVLKLLIWRTTAWTFLLVSS